MRNNKRLVISLAGAVIFGILGVVLVTRYISNAEAYTKSLDNVVVALNPIPLGAKITAEHLTTTPIPNGSTPEGAFRKIDEVVGRVAITPIGVREPLTSSKLAAVGIGAGLSAVIPEGYRAMTVKVDDVVGVSGFVMPGALVDVVVVINPVDTGGPQNPISKIVLQNIKVLANGQNIDRPKNDREAEAVKAVTLQVTPDQAEKLALASSEGKLQLVMRNGVDQGDEQTQGVDKRRLLGGENAAPVPAPGSLKSEQPARPAPVVRRAAPERPRMEPVKARLEVGPAGAVAPPAPPRQSVEVIEGAKKRSVDFP